MGRYPARGPSGLYNARGWGRFPGPWAAPRIEDGAVYRISKPPRPDGIGHTTIPLTDRKR